MPPANTDPAFHPTDSWRNPRGWRRVAAIAGLAALLLAVAVLTYLTGGTHNVYLHAAYIPVLLGGYLFRRRGGIIAGAVAGLLLGPFMPIDAAEGTMQTTSAWLYRTAFFMLIGGFVGQMSRLLNLRLDQLHESVEDMSITYGQTLKAFASLVAYRDEETAGHCDRVGQNALIVGNELGLSKLDLNNLYWAGVLHDLGKVAVPTEILLKPGPLLEEEMREIRKHPVIGGDLLLEVSSDFTEIAAGVRSHHEYWDGNGYPDGLAGEEIPLFGRILAVVDVFEALTSRRPYRGPMKPSEALDYIREQAGRHFDPELVAVFERLIAEGELFLAGDEELTRAYRQEQDLAPLAVSVR